MGFPVIPATEGQEGVEKSIEENPYLILVDLMMLRMNGREATRKIRSIPETRDISILAAPLLLKNSDRKNCLEAGCTDYIVKAFSFLAPQEKIQALIPGSSPNTIITGGGIWKFFAALSRCLCI